MISFVSNLQKNAFRCAVFGFFSLMPCSVAQANWEVVSYNAGGIVKQGPTIVFRNNTYECLVGEWRDCEFEAPLNVAQANGQVRGTHFVQERLPEDEGYNDAQELNVSAKFQVVSATVRWTGTQAPPSRFAYKELAFARLTTSGDTGRVFVDDGARGATRRVRSRDYLNNAAQSGNTPAGVFRSLAVPDGVTEITVPINRTMRAQLNYL